MFSLNTKHMFGWEKVSLVLEVLAEEAVKFYSVSVSGFFVRLKRKGSQNDPNEKTKAHLTIHGFPIQNIPQK